MSATQWIGGGVLLLLVFWAVGAHHRLTALRVAAARAFGPVDTRLREREGLLLAHLDALHGVAPPPALRAVASALQALRGHAEAAARPRPNAAAIARLKAGQDELADARARLAAELAGLPRPPTPPDALLAADSALVFAERQFNESADAYGEAIRQFPALLLARVAGFKPAGRL